MLGAYLQWSYWAESPQAREILRRAKTLDDARDVWVSVDTDDSTQRVVIFTRKGLVPLTAYFEDGAQPSLFEFNRFVEGKGPERAEIACQRLSAVLLAAVPALIGLVLIATRGDRTGAPDQP